MIEKLLSVIRELKYYWGYIIYSARCSLMAEVSNSYLNWLWWLIEPLGSMCVYYLVFGYVFQSKEDNFALFIIIGVTMWGFFSGNLMSSINFLRMSRAIISEVYIPKYILLLSHVFISLFKMCLAFVLVLIIMIVNQLSIGWSVLFTVPCLVIFFMLTYGCSLILMHLGVYVRDLFDAMRIILQLMVYVSGVFYSLSKRVPAPYGPLLEKANPVAFLISSFRNALIYNTSPDGKILLVWFLFSVLLIVIGLLLIKKYENDYVKMI